MEWLGYNFVNSAIIMIFIFLYLQAYYVGFWCKATAKAEENAIKVSSGHLKPFVCYYMAEKLDETYYLSQLLTILD